MQYENIQWGGLFIGQTIPFMKQITRKEKQK